MRLRKIENLLFVGFLILFITPCCLAQDEDFHWVYKHYPSILEEFLPFDEEADVSFKLHGDSENDVLEYSCSFIRKDDRGFEIVVRQAVSDSLFYQALVLHRKNPTWNIERLKKELKLNVWRLNDKTCPAAKTQLHNFDTLSLPVLSKEDRENAAKGITMLSFHATVYDFEANISGGSLKLELWNNIHKHPFIVWAKDTRQILESCISKAESNNSFNRTR